MKSYREIADSVFARREQYVIAQRKKKQLVTRVTASVGSVALVSLAGIALLRSDAFRETPPISDGGATTTTTHIPTEGEDTTTTTVNTTVPAPTTDGGVVAPTTTATTVPTTAPSKTEPPKTTATTTAPTKLLITGDEPDDYGADCFGDESPKFRYGEISPLLKEAMEKNKDANAVYAVLVAVCPRFDQASAMDEMNKAVEEFKATDEMVQLAEQEKWGEYHNRVTNFKVEYGINLANLDVDALAKLSETELFDLVADAYSKPSDEVSPIVLTLHMYSYRASYFYSAVLSADAINELAERGTYMFWLDSPDTINDVYNDSGYNVDE